MPDEPTFPPPSLAQMQGLLEAQARENEALVRENEALVRENEALRAENAGYRANALRTRPIDLIRDVAEPVSSEPPASVSLRAISRAVGIREGDPDPRPKPLVTRGENRWLTLAIALLVAISTVINAVVPHH